VLHGGEFRDVFAYVGRLDWQDHRERVAAAYGGFQARDLYPDALPALAALLVATVLGAPIYVALGGAAMILFWGTVQ